LDEVEDKTKLAAFFMAHRVVC